MALHKSITRREGVRWMNCSAGRGAVTEWAINLIFVSQWEYNLALCRLLLTKISIPSGLWTKCLTGGVVRNVSLHQPWVKHDKSLLQHSPHSVGSSFYVTVLHTISWWKICTLVIHVFPLGLVNLSIGCGGGTAFTPFFMPKLKKKLQWTV